MPSKKKKLAPINCRTLDDVCRLNRDGFDTEDFWILTDSYQVSITQQRMGEPSTASVSVPKKDFDKLVRWYLREQSIKGQQDDK